MNKHNEYVYWPPSHSESGDCGRFGFPLATTRLALCDGAGEITRSDSYT